MVIEKIINNKITLIPVNGQIDNFKKMNQLSLSYSSHDYEF
jgi:hypothetical protein